MRKPRSIGEEQKAVLEKLLKTTKKKADYRRVMCIWLRACLGLSSSEVAKAIGWSSSTVKILQARYFKEGESALLGVGRGGRRRENLSVEEEERLLERFLEKAKAGGLLVVSEVKAAYEEAVGHSVPKSTVYRMLARHGWRKIAPRPRHPKSDKEKQERFKKNSPPS
ncbi:MAG: winged helix-turn-helix domain-containing protein [Deltaproteobacteria bacterium]|nr:winged helix-turn-helix domain-containing protein [Deltaproteobacteria bacterium]